MLVRAIIFVALLSGSCWAQPERHVVIVDLDGVRRDLLETTYRAGKMPQLERLFGKSASFSNALYFEQATTIAPTVTMAGQASLFTGSYPGVHGIPGTNWFDRAQAAVVDYMSYTGAACVYGFALFGMTGCEGGRANQDLTTHTLYDSASAAGFTSVVVYNQYWKGATRVIEPSISDALALLQGGDLNLELFDQNMTARAIAEMQQNGRPSILTLYFAGADSTGHAHGTGPLMDYLSQVIDPLLGTLFDALEALDPGWRLNTLFIFSADHGRTDASATPDDGLALALMASTLATAGFDADHAHIANEGGLAYIYLRPPGAFWSESPAVVELKAAASALADDPSLATEIDSVCYRDRGYHCAGQLGAAHERLLNASNSARTGDLVILARPGRYFANRSPEGAEHGALDDTDLAIPLILAGGGVLPGRISTPVSNVQIAATVAAYLGFPITGAEPALPGVVHDWSRHRFPPPGRLQPPLSDQSIH